MRDDQELFYASGEMSDAELQAFEASLSEQDRHEAALLKSAFASLKRLNDDIPEPQISFARVQDAIQRQAVAPKKASFPWQRFMVFATPVAATILVVSLVIRQSNPDEPAGAEMLKRSVATIVPKSGLAQPKSANVPPAATPNAPIEVASAPKPSTEPVTSEPTPRSPRRMTVAMNVPQRRASAGLPKAISLPADAPQFGTMAGAVSTSPAPEDTGGTGNVAPNARGGASAGVEVATGPSETVVIVSAAPDQSTGANAAVEVKKNDDVVLGG